MTIAQGVRIGWDDLPVPVRDAVEKILGAPVVDAVSQSGGFSPGTADRVRTADGRRAFVKAVSAAQNERSPVMHRQEAKVTAGLPAGVPAPRLLGCYDEGEWVALVLEDVPGRHPVTPWVRGELDAVFSTLDSLARWSGAERLDIDSAAGLLGDDLAGWLRIDADPPPELDPWTASRMDQLCALSVRGIAALGGNALVHGDVRADNLLIRPDGTVVVVDWPWACRGPAWLDRLLLLVNVRLFGGHDCTALLTECAAATGADPADLVAVLVGVAGFFADITRQPPPPGLPTVRAFQRAQADAVLSWLREDDLLAR
jgi:hypothetical protein